MLIRHFITYSFEAYCVCDIWLWFFYRKAQSCNSPLIWCPLSLGLTKQRKPPETGSKFDIHDTKQMKVILHIKMHCLDSSTFVFYKGKFDRIVIKSISRLVRSHLSTEDKSGKNPTWRHLDSDKTKSFKMELIRF